MLESIFLRKKVSKSGYVHGARNSLSTGDNVAPNAKTSEWQRAGHQGGGGGIPRDLLRPGFLRLWIPARDRAGNHAAGLDLRWSKPEPPAKGSPLDSPPKLW